MDMTQSIVPKSDQLNADDLMTGARTFTIKSVSAGSAEQPIDIHLVETSGRAFRPSKSMRRVMVAGWGSETDAYTGRKMTLYRDPRIKFGKDEVGGIRISHMSHIDKTLKLALTVTRGKREAFEVEPLTQYISASHPSLANSEQIEQIGALLSRLEITVRDEAVAKLNSIIEPRQIAARSELTKEEASIVIKVLSAEVEARQ